MIMSYFRFFKVKTEQKKLLLILICAIVILQSEIRLAIKA